MNGIIFALLLGSQAFAHAVDLTRLPIGDGKISQSPKKGWIWACHVDPMAGGAHQKGPWIRSDGTYDFTAKAVVPGKVKWPSRFDISVEGTKRVFSANDLPDHPTGTFPVPSDSKAYQYDRNPNRITEQSMRLELPRDPVLASAPTCAPGAVGILLSGSVLFNALDAPGRDAVAHETQDACQGHPQESGVYHYHSLSTCVKDKPGADGHSQLVGYAVDGFGIFGRKGEGGKILTSADLDECHGHNHAIDWDGKKKVMYHYHATWDFPYTLGCVKGKYSMEVVRTISGPPPNRRGHRGEISSEPNPNPHRPRRGGHPDLGEAARKLGVSREALHRALGPPPPDLNAAAARLGVPVQKLRDALGAP